MKSLSWVLILLCLLSPLNVLSCPIVSISPRSKSVIGTGPVAFDIATNTNDYDKFLIDIDYAGQRQTTRFKKHQKNFQLSASVPGVLRVSVSLVHNDDSPATCGGVALTTSTSLRVVPFSMLAPAPVLLAAAPSGPSSASDVSVVASLVRVGAGSDLPMEVFLDEWLPAFLQQDVPAARLFVVCDTLTAHDFLEARLGDVGGVIVPAAAAGGSGGGDRVVDMLSAAAAVTSTNFIPKHSHSGSGLDGTNTGAVVFPSLQDLRSSESFIREAAAMAMERAGSVVANGQAVVTGCPSCEEFRLLACSSDALWNGGSPSRAARDWIFEGKELMPTDVYSSDVSSCHLSPESPLQAATDAPESCRWVQGQHPGLSSQLQQWEDSGVKVVSHSTPPQVHVSSEGAPPGKALHGHVCHAASWLLGRDLSLPEADSELNLSELQQTLYVLRRSVEDLPLDFLVHPSSFLPSDYPSHAFLNISALTSTDGWLTLELSLNTHLSHICPSTSTSATSRVFVTPWVASSPLAQDPLLYRAPTQTLSSSDATSASQSDSFSASDTFSVDSASRPSSSPFSGFPSVTLVYDEHLMGGAEHLRAWYRGAVSQEYDDLRLLLLIDQITPLEIAEAASLAGPRSLSLPTLAVAPHPDILSHVPSRYLSGRRPGDSVLPVLNPLAVISRETTTDYAMFFRSNDLLLSPYFVAVALQSGCGEAQRLANSQRCGDIALKENFATMPITIVSKFMLRPPVVEASTHFNAWASHYGPSLVIPSGAVVTEARNLVKRARKSLDYVIYSLHAGAADSDEDIVDPLPMSRRACLPIHPRIVVFNRTPKSGTTSTKDTALNLLTQTRRAAVLDLVAGHKNPDGVQIFEWDDFDLLVTGLSTMLHASQGLITQHLYYAEKSVLRGGGMLEPVWINQVREPFSRIRSFYDYWRGFGLDFHHQHAKYLSLPGSNFTFEECVENHRSGRACMPEDCLSFDYQLRFYCGNSSVCHAGGGEAGLALAKENIERNFAVVGVLNRLDDVIEMLELRFPSLFEGLAAEFQKDSHINVNEGRNRNPVREGTREYVMQHNERDQALYTWVENTFREHFSTCVSS